YMWHVSTHPTTCERTQSAAAMADVVRWRLRWPDQRTPRRAVRIGCIGSGSAASIPAVSRASSGGAAPRRSARLAATLSRAWVLYVPLDGGELGTLREAGDYISRLPKREQAKPEWQMAAKYLLR